MLRRHLPRPVGHPLSAAAWYVLPACELVAPPPPERRLQPATATATTTTTAARRIRANYSFPYTVWVKRGICSADSIINILLCCLGFIPGLFHAWYIIAKFPEPPYEYEALPNDREGGRVTYVYVQSPHGSGCNGQQQQPRPQGGMNYGTQAQNQSQGQQQQHGVTGAGEGGSNGGGVPPSYAEVVAGDHKVQSRD